MYLVFRDAVSRQILNPDFRRTLFHHAHLPQLLGFIDVSQPVELVQTARVKYACGVLQLFKNCICPQSTAQ